MFKFCLIGGIVCSSCNYPIASNEGYKKEIHKHEKSSKKHNNTTTLDQPSKVLLISRFNEYVGTIAKQVVLALPDVDIARNIILAEIGTSRNQYKYCTECKVLVFDTKVHRSNSHITLCKDDGWGYASKYWTKKNAKVIPDAFSLDDESCFCAAFNDAIKKELQIQRKTLVLNDTKVQAFSNYLLLQQQAFNQTDDSISMQCMDINKNPDLWLRRTGWDDYMKDFNAHSIYETTSIFDKNIEPLCSQLETNLKIELNECIRNVRSIKSIHQIFHEVERRPHKTYPNKPFQIPSGETCNRYVSTICMIIRVIIRVYNYQKNHDGGQSKYPNICLSNYHASLIDTLQRDPDTKASYITLLLALMEQQYTSHPYECAFICAMAFTAVKADGSFKSPSQFTPVYAALIGICKVLVIHKSMSDALDDSHSIELAKLYTLKYLAHPDDIQSRPNVMSYVINVFSYAFTISRNTTLDGFVAWNDNTLIFRDVRLSMNDFRLAIANTITNAEKLLLLLCEVSSMSKLPIIPWHTTYDDVNNSNYNYSFITEPKNNYTHESKLFNAHRIAELWIDDNNQFNVHHITIFKRNVKAFLEAMLCLVHLTAGQPARGTEIIIIQHTNSISSSNCSRNIYIDRGLVLFYSRYHKNMVKSNKTKDIFRFLPPQVGSLMVYYLWLVLPFYQNVIGSFENKHFKSAFLWTDNIVDTNSSTSVWDSHMLTLQLKKCFTTNVGTDMNTAIYRHVAIAIVRKYLDESIIVKRHCQNNVVDIEDDEGEDNIWDLQAGHKTSTATNVYARTIDESNISSQSTLDKCRYISLLWHDFILQGNHVFQQISFNQLSKTLHDQRVNRFVRLKIIPPEKC